MKNSVGETVEEREIKICSATMQSHMESPQKVKNSILKERKTLT